MSIYNLSTFVKSYLQLPDINNNLLTFVAVLNSERRGNKDEIDASAQLAYAQVFEGNLINPALLPTTVHLGSVGTGTINGVSGRVRLLNVFGSNLAIALAERHEVLALLP